MSWPCPPHPDRRTFLRLGAAWATTGLLTACQPVLPPLRVGSIAFPGYEPVFLARENGWLDPTQVRLIELFSNTDALRALAARQLEAAQLTLDEFLTGRAGGVDLRVIAVLDLSEGADVVIARPGLRTPNQPAGLRIAVEEGAVGALMLAAYLRHVGLTAQQVTTVPMPLAHGVQALRDQAADLFISAEPWATQLEQRGGVRVFDSTAIPGRIVDVLVVRADAMASHASALQALVAAHFRAVQWAAQHPADAARLMAPRLQLPATEVLTTFKGLRQPSAADSRALLAPDGLLMRQVRTLEESMLADGLIAHTSPLDALFDSRFHP